MRNKLPIALSLAALVVALLGAVPVAQSHGVFHAIFAHRAGAVDGKSAVGPGATLNRAAGKLVATKARGTDRGKFLKKFIPKVDSAVNADNATNAGALDGLDSTQLAPILRAQRDTGGGGTTLVGAGQTEINSVALTAPVAGFVVISGSVFLNNNGVRDFFDLIPLVDGATVGDGAKAVTELAADAAFGEVGSLAYTVAAPVTAGPHTVSQTTGPQTGTTDFFYNRNNLTVTFIPGNLGAVARPIGAAGRAPANG